MFQALADNAINIQMISTSEIKIACIISRDKVDNAVKVLTKNLNWGRKNNPVVFAGVVGARGARPCLWKWQSRWN